jgi:hypothetical protein
MNSEDRVTIPHLLGRNPSRPHLLRRRRAAHRSSSLDEKHLRRIAVRIPMNASEHKRKVAATCSLVHLGKERRLKAEHLCERVAQNGKLRFSHDALADAAHEV